MTAVDFEVLGREEVENQDQLAALLSDQRTAAVRLCGSGSSLRRLPAPRRPVVLVSLAPMGRITRLEPADLTCSVEPGLARVTLDAELARHGLVLPTPGEGTIGGLLARGEHQPLAPGALTARNVVLGLEGVLSDGTRFKVGARVVKSVAGFDLHRAFVGSRGRLFAATLFHLKLKPAPRATLAFAQGPMPLAPALRCFTELRLLPTPPRVLMLQRDERGAFTVAGGIDGAAEHVDEVSRRHGLCLAQSEPRFDLTDRHGAARDVEVVDGSLAPSAVPDLLAALPPGAPAHVSGTGQFQAVLAPAASDALLAWLAQTPSAVGEIRCGSAARRGHATSLDPGAAKIEDALRLALDPRGVLQ
jgi:FAD/FMN-containing dehydrogenase